MNWTRFFAAFFGFIGGFGIIIAYSLFIEWVDSTVSPAWTSVGTATPQKPTSRHTTPKHSPILVGAYFYAQNLGERRGSRGGGLTAPTCVIHETD